jgi:hypothetical protein
MDVNVACGSHGTLMWWWQPWDLIRYNASFVAYNSYIVRTWCLVIWATILWGVAKEELAYVQRQGLKWRPCLQGVVGMSLPHWTMPKHSGPFLIYMCPISSTTNHQVPLTTLLLRAPKKMVHNVLKHLGLAWMIIHMSNLAPRHMRQMTLQERMNSTTKFFFDKKWATFYEANIPFNGANHSAFVDAMKSTFDCKIIYKLSSYHVV